MMANFIQHPQYITELITENGVKPCTYVAEQVLDIYGHFYEE